MKYSSWLLVLLLFLLSSARQQPFSVKNVPDPKQHGGGYVSNPDHLISDITVDSLNSQLALLDQAHKAQVALVLLRSIGDKDSKEFAHELFNYWRIGEKATNNGLLVLLVNDAHKLVFETGKGIEGDMPDITCFHIQQEYMIPRIKEGNYDAAFMNGVHAIRSLFYTGNYAYDQLSAPVVSDTSLMAADDSTVYAPTQTFAGNSSSNVASASSDPPGGGFFFALIFCFIVTLAIIHACFGWKKTRKADDEPMSVGDLPNEYLRPGWMGVLLVNVLAVYLFWWVNVRANIHLGFLTAILVYYVVWALFVHLAVLIIRVRAEMALRGADRHERWQRLEAAHQHLKPMAYMFPLPFLLLYLQYFRSRQDKLRNDPYNCPNCRQAMQKLDEKTEEHYLDKAQVMEEKMQSVDYDVWRCDHCKQQLVLDYTNVNSAVSICPSCSHKTFQCKKTITKARATTSSEGWGMKTYVCAACAFTHDYKFVIAKLSSSSSGGSSSFSSDSDAFSSSSSSDWGGGSSDGGGASSSW
ncbi:TPM domain-containing protein [Chitinophaga vietnamensis]|uniref:TPM domain-containing protein n=1 Tax=Chitinophaga vietnamensis TaxID=2593957 RepID=UPI001375A965|nr:TPM domain-containing protein [Chitinophaga vietnamensis]